MLQSESLSLSSEGASSVSLATANINFIEKCEQGIAGTVPYFCDEWTEILGKLSNELLILHAPRSTGKTAILVQWHRRLAELEIKCPLLSLESPIETINQRYLAQQGKINTLDMRRKNLHPTSQTFVRARQASSELEAMSEYLIIDDGTYTMSRIRSYATMQKKMGAKALMIDNLLCISDNSGAKSRTEMYMHFLQELREIRNEIQIPIILLAHPNAEGKLAWSSDAENLVDILIYMYDVSALRAQDPDKFDKSKQSVISLNPGHKHIACKFQKNRDGETPRLNLDFYPDIQTFTPITRDY